MEVNNSFCRNNHDMLVNNLVKHVRLCNCKHHQLIEKEEERTDEAYLEWKEAYEKWLEEKRSTYWATFITQFKNYEKDLTDDQLGSAFRCFYKKIEEKLDYTKALSTIPSMYIKAVNSLAERIIPEMPEQPEEPTGDTEEKTDEADDEDGEVKPSGEESNQTEKTDLEQKEEESELP